MKAKAILFDFNGTMVFDSPKHKDAWNAFSLKYRGCPISDEEMEHMHGKNNDKIIEMLLETPIDPQTSKNLSKTKEAMYRDACKHDPSYSLAPGLIPFLNTCRDHKIPMTIATASIKENVDFFIDCFGLKQWFDPNKMMYDDGTHEDKISMFLDGAKALHTDIKDCLVFEDSLSGITFAHQAGAGSIIAVAPLKQKERYLNLKGVDDVIQDFTQVDFSAIF